MFSLSGVNVSICPKSFDNEGYNDRPVNAQDIKWILNAWKSQHASDTLALLPGENISEWSNHGMQCRCSVVSKNSRVLGYVRYVNSEKLNIKELVCKSEDVPGILSYLAWKRYGEVQGEMSIAVPVEKLHATLGNSSNYKITDEQTAHKAFMIKILEPMSPVANYCGKVEQGVMKPGIIISVGK